MRRKGLGLQRGLAMVLSAAMLLTGINFPAITADAAVVNQIVWSDDMETKTTEEAGWTVTWGNGETTAGTENRAANAWAKNNTTVWWHFETDAAADTLTLSHTVSALEAGAYKASVDVDGGNATGKIAVTTVSDVTASGNEDVDTQTADITLGGWDEFVTTTTDVLNVTETSDVTIKITFDSQTEGWFDLDNIKLIQEVDEEAVKAAAVTALGELISVCEALEEADYTSDSYAALQTAITEAKAVYDAAEEKTTDEITAATTALQAVKDKLVSVGVVENAGINVEKVEGITEDFVRGVDVSTFASLVDSGVKFYNWDGEEVDEVGFFTLLKDAGVNYVRLRCWNDPYYTDEQSVKHGYGAGNCDVATVTKIGKWATEAGLKVVVDFHYSDFWADPGKYRAPKAWEEYSIEQKVDALSTFTEESLAGMIDAGVDVGMVQVGNETTVGLAGETSWENKSQLFAAGCAAVRKVAADKGKAIKIAIHFTNPEKTSTMKGYADTLNKYDIDYDVFATSYYSYWHGSLSNLTSVLSYVAETYDKEVMVAETSWAHTLADGDGQPNVVREGQNDTGTAYASTVQGQANAVRDVINAVSNVGEKGLGVMYWEPAWLPVNVYDADADNAEEIYAANYEAWETYGCGWASSYAVDYDGSATVDNYGGSEWDNQALFDFYGNPLPSLNVFKYVETGATTPRYMDSVTDTTIDVKLGADIAAALPATVDGVYNDGTTAEGLPVVWNAADIAAITSHGRYKVKGIVSYETDGGEQATIEAVCTVNVEPESLLLQSGFEEGRDQWTVEGTGVKSSVTAGDSRSGSGNLGYYSGNEFSFTVQQTYTAALPGTYNAYMYIQGNASAAGEEFKIELSNDTTGASASANTTLEGWLVWKNAEAKAIKAAIGDELTVTITVTGAAGSWGTIDDVCLYMTETDPYYNVVYNLAEGENAAENPAIYDGNKTITLAAPTREGYTFEGWYTDSAFTAPITEIAQGATGDVTVYAKWKKAVYAITYELNGGVNNEANAASYKVGEGLTLADPTREGYIFKGWYTDADFTNAITEIAADKEEDITVYAKWEEKPADPPAGDNNGNVNPPAGDNNGNVNPPAATSYNITYVLNGGTNAVENPTVYSDADIALKNPTRKGYTFAGWYTDAACTTKITGISAAAKADVTVYAKWTKVTVKKPTLKSVKNQAGKKAKVTIKKVSGATGYQIQYSTNNKFKKSVKTVTTKKTTATLSKLKKGKTYYVKVCAYKEDSTGEKVCGQYSKVLKVKIKK